MRSLYSDFEFRPAHVMLIDVHVHSAGYKVLGDGIASPLSPSLGYNGRTTRVVGPLRVKGDPTTGLMEVGVMVKTYSLLVARLVA